MKERIKMPKIFTDDEREEKRVQMFRAGLDLIKENGYTHASVEKIAEAAGLGKGTFYNFFTSKEDFMAQLIEHGHKLFWQYVDGLRNEAGKLSEAAMKDILRAIIYNTDSPYQYMTPDEKRKVLKAQSDDLSPDLDEETQILKALFAGCDSVRKDPDYAEISNLLKLLASAAGDREVFHSAGYERMMNDIYELLFEKVFE